MKLKTFVVLLIILCALSITAFYIYSHNSQKKTSDAIGEKLFDTLPLETISRIAISSSEDLVVLKKQKDMWVVENRNDYLADFSIITDLVTRLKNVKIGRSFKASEDAVNRLGLVLPKVKEGEMENQGIGIEIFDNQNNALLNIIIGKTREMAVGAGDGSYMMFANEELIYLVDQTFDAVGKYSLDWIKKDIINVDKEDIEKITCHTADGSLVYTLVRPQRGQWPVLAGVNPQPALSLSKLDDLLTPLSPMTITDIAARTNDNRIPETLFTHYFNYTLYDGTILKVIPGKLLNNNGEGYFLLKAALILEGKTPDKDSQHSNIIQKDISLDLVSDWIYVIPQWKYKRFINQIEGLIEPTS